MGVQQEIDQELAIDATLTEGKQSRIDGISVGRLVAFKDGSIPLVSVPQAPVSAALPARSTIELRGEDIGEDVVVQFENGDYRLPIILGKIRQSQAWPLKEQPGNVSVEADGERLTLDAKQEIVLRCGKASITLTKAGKVLIRGTYISSRSSGANRIKGGSVLLN